MLNPVAPYRYLLPDLYLSVADIANPDLFACGSRTWNSLDIARFYEEQCQPALFTIHQTSQHCRTNEAEIRILWTPGLMIVLRESKSQRRT